MAEFRHPQAAEERAFSWFPGHMLKAQKRLSDDVKHVDVILELRDARLPMLSGNPEITRIIGQRPHLILFNKTTLADAQQTAAWTRYLTAQGLAFRFLDADSGKALNVVLAEVDKLAAPMLAKFRARGIRPPQPKLMIAGMPNVGKSTLINRWVHSNRQKVAPMPGVTRHVTWINLRDKYLLMDTPGVMLPRIQHEQDALHLTWIGAIKDSILGADRVAIALLAFILAQRPADLASWTEGQPTPTPETVLDGIGKQRGMLGPGGVVNRNLAAEWLLHHYREGEVGRYTFEAAPA